MPTGSCSSSIPPGHRISLRLELRTLGAGVASESRGDTVRQSGTPDARGGIGNGDGTSGTTTELVFVYPAPTSLSPGVISASRARRAHLRAHHLREGDAEDVARLARFVTNRTVGIALGGGGARGFAHIGAVAAIREGGPFPSISSRERASAPSSVPPLPLATRRKRWSTLARRYIIEDAPFFDPAIPFVALLRGRRLPPASDGFSESGASRNSPCRLPQ
jgi:hypothetical protein